MGAGKTTVGKKIARQLNRPFVDTDRFIETRYHRKISEIFAEKGEEFFRETEHNILQEIAQFENTVISTGGGAPCFFDNMELMNRSGITVYLKVSVAGLVQRLTAYGQDRPLIKNKTRDELERFIALHLEERESWYHRAAIIFPTENLWTSSEIDATTENLMKRINEIETGCRNKHYTSLRND
jgi:shikimate kinase